MKGSIVAGTTTTEVNEVNTGVGGKKFIKKKSKAVQWTAFDHL